MSATKRRPLGDHEIETAVDLFLASATDMTQRHGVQLPPVFRPSVVAQYAHIQRTGIFHVAEAEGQIVGLACAIVRDLWWFLSGFWVKPGLQGQRIGGPLLDAVIREGERAGARTFFTWSSVDPRAMATYMRRGLLPGWPMLIFVGEPSMGAPASSTYDLAELDEELPPRLARAARQPPRAVDHAFWRAGAGAARAVVHRGAPVGYFYARAGGIGPVAWSDEEHAPAVIDRALAAAVALATAPVRVNVPGVAHVAIRHLLARGLQIASYGHMLATEAPGDMTRYLPSNALLL
jgi:GNAT superfamily N-acetyltransferase